MTIYEIWQDARKNRILGCASEETVNRCLTEQKLFVRELLAGEEIYSPVRREEHVGILLEGRAVISSADGGRHVRLRTVGEGAIFGIATLFTGEDSFPTRICAATRCRVLLIDADAFRRLIREDANANEAFLRFLCERVVYLNKKIEAFTAGSAERRLALFLCDNECDGVFYADGSFSALAQALDIGRASLYRALDALEAEGWIEKRDKSIRLTNKAAMLEKYSRG